MGRKAKGKPLTLMPIRVDEDVKAAILKLKDKHDTINEGLRTKLIDLFPDGMLVSMRGDEVTAISAPDAEEVNKRIGKFLRGIRPKGDAKR